MLYLSLGTNLGSREDNLRRAIAMIQERIGNVVSQSAFLQTEPWGYQSANQFLNACIGVETTLSPHEALRKTQAIERQMGRRHKTTDDGHYHDRIIDIDLLLYDDLIIHDPDLVIPHPLMAERLFVLRPLAEIAHDHHVPGSTMSVGEMLSALEARS